MSRWLPLVIVLVAILAIGLYFAPGIYRGTLFKRDMRDLLNAVLAGDKAKALSYIESTQQNAIAPLVMNRVPADYSNRIASLKLSSWQRADPNTIWAVVTLRIDQDSTGGLYQGKLRWVYDAAGRRWWWDFAGSYGSAYPLSGEPDWQPLSEALEYARTL